jgi:Cu2+-exporting ATPase
MSRANEVANKAPTQKPTCKHCGALLIDEHMIETGFCCSGCTYVYRLIHNQGLDSYYTIKDSVTAPAASYVFQNHDYAWLETSQRDVENTCIKASTARAIPELTLDIQGISCVGCVWLIERVFMQQQGARECITNAQYGTLRLRWNPPEFSIVEFAKKLQSLGYLLGPADEQLMIPESRGIIKKIGLCTAFAMNIMLFSFPTYFGMEPTFEYAHLFQLLSLVFGTLSFLVGGTYFIARSYQAVKEKTLHIDTPISIGIVGAYIGSVYGWFRHIDHFIYFDFLGSFIVLMLIGRWAQVAAVERNQRRLLSKNPRPSKINLKSGSTLSSEQVTKDLHIILKAGSTLPVDSRLLSDHGIFSLASINGESEPREFTKGQLISAGAISLTTTPIELHTLQDWHDSILYQLLENKQRHSERHIFLERIVRGYLIGILFIALITGITWWFRAHNPVKTWSVVTAVLVVSCPCAIGLAFPLAEEIASLALRRKGVFVRDNDLWSKLSRIKKIIFDKTGTLTLETPVLQNPDVFKSLTHEQRNALFTLVRDTHHPISEAILEHLLIHETPDAISGVCTEHIGQGVEIGPWALGKSGWKNYTKNNAGTLFTYEDKLIATFYFNDRIRPRVKEDLENLTTQGFTTFILSGDSENKVTSLALELGIPKEHAKAQLNPEAKAQWITHYAKNDSLMLGDGANDSLAFDSALCRGTPVIHRGILERKADFYYLGKGINGLNDLFRINKIRSSVQLRILIFSIIYNVIAVGFAVFGLMNPLLAAILMPINSLLTLFIVTVGMKPAFK